MNPSLLPQAMSKIVGQMGFFCIGKATDQGEGNFWIQTAVKIRPGIISSPHHMLLGEETSAAK